MIVEHAIILKSLPMPVTSSTTIVWPVNLTIHWKAISEQSWVARLVGGVLSARGW